MKKAVGGMRKPVNSDSESDSWTKLSQQREKPHQRRMKKLKKTQTGVEILDQQLF